MTFTLTPITVAHSLFRTAVYDEDDPGHPYTVTAPDRTEQDKKINAMLQKHHCDPLDGFTVRFGE